MIRKTFALACLFVSASAATSAAAQLAPGQSSQRSWMAPSLEAVGHPQQSTPQSGARVESSVSLREDRQTVGGNGSRPVLRTFAALLGSAGAFALAEDRANREPDDLIIPIAAGIGGGALGAMLFTNAHPIRVLLGSALAALPAAAVSTYLVGVTEDSEQEPYMPLLAFSLPHGFLTSALAQQR